MISPKFIFVQTADGLSLPGLLYEKTKTKKAAVFLHGNGSSSVFYKGNQQIEIVEALAKAGISSLLFNNRGAHLIKKLTVEKPDRTLERKRYGMAYEIIKECVEDIDGAVAFLKSVGYTEFFLIGESTGANKICVYDHYKKNNEFSRYVLTSAGDDTGIYYHMLGDKKFHTLLEKAKNKVAKGSGDELMKELLPNELFSYKGFCDIANPNGDYNCFPYYEVLNNVKLSSKPLFNYFGHIKIPSLVIYGGNDEFAWGKVPEIIRILKKRRPEFMYKIIENTDHGFNGKEPELAEAIVSFLH